MTVPDPLLPVVSKVLGAELRFGGTAPDYADGAEFACDAKSIKVTPSSDKDGDDVILACGTTIPAPRKTSYTLNGTGIQRFDEADRMQAFCYTNDGMTVHFWLRFNDGDSPVYEGDVVIERLEEGGDAGNDPGDLTFEFDGVGDYTRTPFAAELDATPPTRSWCSVSELDAGAPIEVAALAPTNLVVDPDPRHWSLIESMEVRREFGYDAEQWQAALKDSPELALIGSAWLALRKYEPGITWKEAGNRITNGDLAGLGDDAGPKARPSPTAASRRARPR